MFENEPVDDDDDDDKSANTEDDEKDDEPADCDCDCEAAVEARVDMCEAPTDDEGRVLATLLAMLLLTLL